MLAYVAVISNIVVAVRDIVAEVERHVEESTRVVLVLRYIVGTAVLVRILTVILVRVDTVPRVRE